MCPNTCPHFARPCIRAATPVSRCPSLASSAHPPHPSPTPGPTLPAHISVATPVLSRLDAASTPARLPSSRARPVLPYAAAVASRHALPIPPPCPFCPPGRRCLPTNCALLSRSTPFMAVGTVAAVIGRPAATTSLRPPPSHDHGCHSLSPEAAAYGRGGSMIPKLSGFARYPWPMSPLPIPLPAPQQRVAFPTHGGFPSPRAASSLNDRSGVSTPPVPTAAKSKDNREVNEWGTRARVPHVPFCPEAHMHNAGLRTELENLELEPDADVALQEDSDEGNGPYDKSR
ncbi:hypothetical protein B0H14DRAFT_3530824 [Mycena olivaceomarginata]|nr:hypothetical protein B0H14DRAFT_3530824 [Mycena olivaceomarginata]